MTSTKHSRLSSDPTDWHPVVAKMKVRFDALFSGQTTRYLSWQEFFPSNVGAGRRADSADAIRCTRSTYERCLLIANYVCYAAEAVGFDVEMGPQCTYIALRRDGGESALRVVEPCFRANTDLVSPEERASVYTHGLIGTGWLEVHVNQHWTSGAVYKEKLGVDLIDSLPRVLAEIERRHAAVVAFEEEGRQRNAAMQRARMEREVAEVRRAEEQTRRDELISSAKKWHISRMIRAYVSAMVGQVPDGKISAEEYEQWRTWALKVADELEPNATPLPPAR